jgi:hypothetical protein
VTKIKKAPRQTGQRKKRKLSAKDTDHLTQLQTIFTYLKKHVATASMVSEATGVKQKNLCRYKRTLECANLLWEVRKAPCKQTGFKAFYLTTDKSKAPKFPINQLNLF